MNPNMALPEVQEPLEEGEEVEEPIPEAAKAPGSTENAISAHSIASIDPTVSTMGNAAPLPDEEKAPLPNEAPPLPDEAPPLPNEEPPDDGWDAVLDPNTQTYYFYNRFTQVSQWNNPRVPEASSNTIGSSSLLADRDSHDQIGSSSTGPPGTSPPRKRSVAGGYNPAIHGNYDPNADYALEAQAEEEEQQAAKMTDPNNLYGAAGTFNRFTGKWQNTALTPENFNDENKSKRQMNAFFDVDAAANSHDGKSLKAERQSKKLTKQQVKEFREKRKAKKEEKRRAWLMD
jgi:hypothetical protein